MEKSCVERFHAESSSFRDVPDGKWYTTYVATLEKAGVIVDSKDGNFRPNDASPAPSWPRCSRSSPT